MDYGQSCTNGGLAAMDKWRCLRFAAMTENMPRGTLVQNAIDNKRPRFAESGSCSSPEDDCVPRGCYKYDEVDGARWFWNDSKNKHINDGPYAFKRQVVCMATDSKFLYTHLFSLYKYVKLLVSG